ncbi:UDP-N-acetylmuramoyl-L-alanine--D-glutamate ligase [Umezakia ovalisporum]|jgi:UDP-N-acetylmuramoylalanine--D-glutamate ligase|uniref:UDP-N-acetylmuramoylalanine--D-glutamate ligase n=1 Tax=Umezakia ovalisporum FSS-62 TaxID=2971776 RepID=A0AA43GYK9_9CYAN|nr:UDP-N-acetylmuramoyl-L-alanine--D-glutamate ligase [Umezakia ovalisporum]MDH6064219.1 UDP-N-acetylmuramoyl-L-alanine--D-glutamate ligase [Umezakia ovalisporum FSS-62]MDH6085236.1 UDP-N-acetylmuramoyl-L-alanine--D-glutamate ligase [Umezakia ovalisporum TAC611]MDH6087728.1 UDP-N-acetylmuramoyl-L-alanine--D-glutamate ligase [Umezakia ovalisporum Ak1311]MDH6102074.1 UDP-N-acetylmuramoyl-L-alanine--D-glutamate ligase [Umezakia ovalisporum ANA283AFssAo]CEJ42824.1 UDP-N-acetylmuramoylalanine--D-gl
MPRASVIGLGKSGVATARLLKQKGWEVVLSDSNTSPNLLKQQEKLAAEEITVKLGHSLDLNGSDLCDLIVVSPGVPWDVPVLVKARELGIETIGEMELAWRHLQASPWVGITGTNGKTTTTALIAAIFQTAGFNAPACGNIGRAACEVALSEEPPDWVIAEISSYQIESSVGLAPRIGIWTTFTPDHLARHKTLENYYNIKAKLLHHSRLKVFNGDDPYLRKNGRSHWPDAYWTSVKGKEFLVGEQGFYIENGWVLEHLKATFKPEKILPTSALQMVGEHNLQNLLMAVAAARLAGIEHNAIETAIRNFSGVPHRLEHICTWQGIDFINDSKATNYDAAEVGLASVNSPAILIAGGEAKPGNDTAWLAKIQVKAAAVLLIGSAAPAFAQRLEEVGYTNYEIVATMARAVPRSAELAKQHQASVVLLSPACASFDQYPNFEMRGEDFRHSCLALMG